MSLRAIVLGKILLVRQPIVQSLRALDFKAFESSDFAEVVSKLNSTSSSLIVMDADGMSQEWRMLAAGLGAKQRAAALVLVTSRFSFDDAHDAMALKVAGVIVKPFRSDQHTARLLDLALRQMNVRARRSTPRFAIPETMNAVLQLSGSDGDEVFRLTSISEAGATIDLESRSVGSLVDPGRFFPLATLSWGEVQLEAAIDVIHSDTHTAGIRFNRVFEGAPRFLRALKERQAKAIGPQGKKRRW
jgi:DNA-binding NarL/FixJ family response regulator